MWNDGNQVSVVSTLISLRLRGELKKKEKGILKEKGRSYKIQNPVWYLEHKNQTVLYCLYINCKAISFS